MNVHLTAWHESESCAWCEKSRECVTVHFDDGFIENAPLCFACLKNAVKVSSRKVAGTAPPAKRPETP